jgi:regulatory protein
LSFENKPDGRRACLDRSQLFEYAVRALGRRMRTEAELRRLLEQRAEPGDRGKSDVESVVAGLKERRYLDDQAFAETYTRLRQENEKFGPRRVRANLRHKGITAGLAESTVDSAYATTNEEALARKHLERKHIPKPVNEKEAARVMRRLLSAGFSTPVVYRILRQWDVPDESLSLLEELKDDSLGE